MCGKSGCRLSRPEGRKSNTDKTRKLYREGMDRQKIIAVFFATIMFTSMLAYGAAIL